MPPSPWMVSTRMAQVPLSISLVTASTSPRGSYLKPAQRTVAEQVAAPAGEEIEVAAALRVPDERFLAADQANGEARVVGDHVLVEKIHDLSRGSGGGRHVKSPTNRLRFRAKPQA